MVLLVLKFDFFFNYKMNFKFFFLLKKKIIFNKLEIIYKIYNLIYFRYFLLINNLNFYKYLRVFKYLLIRQKCLISKKSRSCFKFCSLSRFKIKEFLAAGFIPNLKKLSW